MEVLVIYQSLRIKGKLDSVCRAVREVFKKYEETENMLDATQAAAEYMETDKNFNTGSYCVDFPFLYCYCLIFWSFESFKTMNLF